MSNREHIMNTLIILGLGFWHLFLVASAVYAHFYWANPPLYALSPIWVDVALWGLTGGCVYCVRGLYLHHCVKQDWDNRWIIWHVFRPFVSTICGAVSLLFVKAGLLLFGISSVESSYYYGVYALAFIAGLNVDNFIKKIESVFKETVGIQTTRAGENK